MIGLCGKKKNERENKRAAFCFHTRILIDLFPLAESPKFQGVDKSS